MPNLKIKAKFLALFILGIFILSGCAKAKSPEKFVATVNGKPVYLKDFKRELALRVKQNPSLKITPNTLNEILDMIIDKNIIIQEAMEKRLAEEARFVDTIKAFWEQTLIRDFIDYKNRETENLLYVTDKEIQDYYEKLKTRTTFNIAKRKSKQDIDALMEKLKSGENIEWDTTASLSYEEVPSEILSKAFELPLGQTGVFEEGYMYYLVSVVNKEPIEVPSLKEIYPDIKEKIGRRKQQQAFNEWLNDERRESNIKINKDILQEVNR